MWLIKLINEINNLQFNLNETVIIMHVQKKSSVQFYTVFLPRACLTSDFCCLFKVFGNSTSNLINRFPKQDGFSTIGIPSLTTSFSYPGLITSVMGTVSVLPSSVGTFISPPVNA